MMWPSRVGRRCAWSRGPRRPWCSENAPRTAAALGSLWLVVALGATGCGTENGCQTDTECKGDRVCQGGQCVAPSGGEDPCRSYSLCEPLGYCTSREGKCIAATDSDCRRWSATCSKAGFCTARDGVCIATSDADCRASTVQCGYYGNCSLGFDDGAGIALCLATSDADCRRSVHCGGYGWCSAHGGKCCNAAGTDCAP